MFVVSLARPISKISITNFRGIKNQTLEFTKFNSLSGKNDCGKSTIINAINLFFSEEKASRDKDFNKNISENKNIEIEVEISEYNFLNLKPFLIAEKDTGFDQVVQDYLIDGVLRVKKIWEFSEKAEISGKCFLLVNSFKEYDIYGDGKNLKKWLTELNLEVPVDGIGGNSDVEKQSVIRNNLLFQNCEREVVEIELKTKDLSNIKKCLPEVKLFRADQSIETTTAEFKKTFSTELKNVIFEQKENSSLDAIETAIKNKIEQESLEIRDFMKQHISDLKELKITPNFDWVKGVEITDVEIKLDGDEGLIPLENKGSGYRRLFMVGRLRYLAKKDESKNIIYLIEEPETFLHPSAQDEMRDSLIDLSESNQIFITTHSPIFTGATKPEGLILCKKENSELKYEKSENENFLIKIATEIGVKPSHSLIDNFEIVIFVESANDEKFYRTVMKKLAYLINNKVLFIHGGGSNIASIIEIKYFQKQSQPNRKIYLLIDSDKFDDSSNNFLNEITSKNNVTVFDEKKNGSSKEQNKIKNLKDNFRGDKVFVLNKRCIENYYHPKIAAQYFSVPVDYVTSFPDGLVVDEYLKYKGLTLTNSKNQHSLFEQMTTQEWQEVSQGELEGIFDEILNTNV